jgi:hypothetical protein
VPASPPATPDPGPGPTRRLRNPFAPTAPRTDATTDTLPDGTGSTSGEPPRRRWTWKPSGDPGDVAETIAGLLIIAAAGLAAVVARGGRRQLRQPTRDQADDLGAPLARIACRHLPMALLSPDLKDVGAFAGALRGYVDDGPLIDRSTDLPTGATT